MVGAYLSYQDTFLWRKVTFLQIDSKLEGAPAPLASLFHLPVSKNIY